MYLLYKNPVLEDLEFDKLYIGISFSGNFYILKRDKNYDKIYRSSSLKNKVDEENPHVIKTSVGISFFKGVYPSDETDSKKLYLSLDKYIKDSIVFIKKNNFFKIEAGSISKLVDIMSFLKEELPEYEPFGTTIVENGSYFYQIYQQREEVI